MTANDNYKNSQDRVIICICGMAGSGKSTVAKKLSMHYGLKYCSGGDALKSVAESYGYKLIKDGWWETKEGLRFLKKRQNDLDIDKKIDKILIESSKKGNVIFDSWTMPWLLKKGFKVWLEASKDVRINRISKRDNLGFEEVLLSLKEKEGKTKEIYKKLYGFELGEDLSPFHLILDVNKLNEEEVFESIRIVIDKLVMDKKIIKNKSSNIK